MWASASAESPVDSRHEPVEIDRELTPGQAVSGYGYAAQKVGSRDDFRRPAGYGTDQPLPPARCHPLLPTTPREDAPLGLRSITYQSGPDGQSGSFSLMARSVAAPHKGQRPSGAETTETSFDDKSHPTPRATKFAAPREFVAHFPWHAMSTERR
jgi:hypothetical protein